MVFYINGKIDFKVGNYVQFLVRMCHEYVEMYGINDVNCGMSCLL